jgi:hypothetical protein
MSIKHTINRYLSLSQGEMCKPYRRLNTTLENQWTLSFEQLQAAINAESSLVSWLDTTIQRKSFDERIHNYNHDKIH